MKRWAVIGGGFRGIIGAHFLAKAGCAVTLVERAPYLGGVMYSDEWNGFYLDKGCHLFDNENDEITDIMHEIMDGDVIRIQVKYASVTEGTKSNGIAVPDYKVLDRATQAQILFEVVEAATASSIEGFTLADLLRHRYGHTLAERLSSAARKMFHIDPSELDPVAFSSTAFRRVRIVPDKLSLLLKESPALDERIAASSQDEPLKFYRHQATRYPHRNFYPHGKGMRSFCEKALSHLQPLGVNVVFGETVEGISNHEAGQKLVLSNGQILEADRVLWAMDAGVLAQIVFDRNPLQDLVHGVPMVVYYFKCPEEQVGDYTYIHDFSEDTLIFRASTPGVYGQQVDADGMTYVCFEVPTKMGSPEWNDPDAYLNAVWQEALSLDIVRGEQPKEHKVLRAPVSYRVAKKGFAVARDELMARLQDFSERIFVAEQTAFSKVDIVATLKGISAL